MKKVLITWYDSLKKASLFCDFVARNYENREATIEKELDYDCYWIYLHIKEEDLSPFQIVSMFQSAIQENPTLLKR